MSLFDFGIYFVLLYMGRPAVTAAYGRPIFVSARQRYVFLRLLFLNLALTSHLCAIYKESQLRSRLAEKYFTPAPT